MSKAARTTTKAAPAQTPAADQQTAPQTEQATQGQDQGQEQPQQLASASHTPADQAAAVTAAPVQQVVELGADVLANAEVLQVLGEGPYPLHLQVQNLMPLPIAFPDLQGLHLGHVAGLPETTKGAVKVHDLDQLTRFATDVQCLSQLNQVNEGKGVQVTVLAQGEAK